MNFDFSPESLALGESARRLFERRGTRAMARAALAGGAGDGDTLWTEMGALGWLGAAIPAAYGGASEGGGDGLEALAVLAEEAGRALAPVPLGPSLFVAAEALLQMGSAAQQARWLPGIADGTVRGTLALAEGPGLPGGPIAASVSGGRLSGTKWPVADGMAAGLLLVVARTGDGAGLFAVDAQDAGVRREALAGLDGSPQARIGFEGAAAERLGDGGWPEIAAVLDRAAVLLAFEQLGGASACLEMATAFAKQRHAFGRPIGGYQAIKHKLADVYIAGELARSNAYGALMAMASGSSDLALLAATARVSATEAYALAAREAVQVHGGIGFTWESDCHLFYRRARGLAAALGTPPYWKDRLVTRLDRANQAA